MNNKNSEKMTDPDLENALMKAQFSESFYTQKELRQMGFKRLGRDVLISRLARIYGAGKIEIGDCVRIDDFAVLSGRIRLGSFIHISLDASIMGGDGVGSSVVMGDFCSLSLGSRILATSDDFTSGVLANPCVPSEFRGVIKSHILLPRHNHIAAMSLVLPKTTFEIGANLGPQSLVCDATLKAFTYYFGAPARALKFLNRDEILRREAEFLARFGGGNAHKNGALGALAGDLPQDSHDSRGLDSTDSQNAPDSLDSQKSPWGGALQGRLARGGAKHRYKSLVFWVFSSEKSGAFFGDSKSLIFSPRKPRPLFTFATLPQTKRRLAFFEGEPRESPLLAKTANPALLQNFNAVFAPRDGARKAKTPLGENKNKQRRSPSPSPSWGLLRGKILKNDGDFGSVAKATDPHLQFQAPPPPRKKAGSANRPRLAEKPKISRMQRRRLRGVA